MPDSELIRVVEIERLPGTRWTPVVGTETFELLRSLGLDTDSTARLQQEAAAILARGVPPSDTPDQATGLVVGYVQSGKTMSFTTVAAMARDNGYHMVIVITGVSKPLFGQSESRLVRDLRLQSRVDRKWQHFSNPKPNDSERRRIVDTLADWNDPRMPEEERRTVLITVMKNRTHLDGLIQLLGSLGLRNAPALIIDDEADQAGLNTKVNQGTLSPTYQRLLALKGSIAHHTFLQYTATPQAPLLINLIDVLSPKFAEVLTPGLLYVGGIDFFVRNPRLVRTIPNQDIPSDANHIVEPPESLLEAMRIFFLGVAAGFVLNRGIGNRSMFVHPSQLKLGHRQYTHWVRQVKEEWKRILEDKGSPDCGELLHDFAQAHEDLGGTVPDLPNFNVLSEHLHRAVRQTIVEEVNTRQGRVTPQIDWKAAYSYILVGGQAMDRGFTVEGLTVSYIPRGVGVGNADTVQQRGRFFGYKRPYLGYCRVFLEGGVRAAFQLYVEHEEDVRQRLVEHRKTGRPLEEWKRAFFLTTALRPTRRNVTQLDYVQSVWADEWYSPAAPHDSDEVIAKNLIVVNQFLEQLNLVEDAGDPRRTDDQVHKVATGIALRQAYEELLVPFRYTRQADSTRFTGLLLQIREYVEEHPDAVCTVYQMSAGRPRFRSVNEDDEIPNLFQGPNYADAAHKDAVYPGDRAIRANNGPTIQVHHLTVRRMDKRTVLRELVPAITIWVPASMARDWLVQPQGGS